MTTTPDGDQHVIPVRVTNHPPAAAATRPRYRTVYQTITLDTAGQAKQLLATATDRYCAFIQALDDNVVISDNQGDAASGAGTIVPKTNGQPYTVLDSGAVYVAAPTIGAVTSRVTIADVHCVYV